MCLSGCVGMSDGVALALRSLLGPLQTVCVGGTAAVTDDVIIHLCANSVGTLEHLNVSGCAQLTSRAIMALLMHSAYSLRRLDVSFIRGVSEEALGALVAGCPDLVQLEVWGCSQLSDRFHDNDWGRNISVHGRMGNGFRKPSGK